MSHNHSIWTNPTAPVKSADKPYTKEKKHKKKKERLEYVEKPKDKAPVVPPKEQEEDDGVFGPVWHPSMKASKPAVNNLPLIGETGFGFSRTDIARHTNMGYVMSGNRHGFSAKSKVELEAEREAKIKKERKEKYEKREREVLEGFKHVIANQLKDKSP